eukprot:TRINITY_DN31148_c0_g1_i2.p1 TRINITY_DN31148_c0_g1~~TRINITY_DN31148_c0_g1_i2.p1  ORF type:complete len:618 (+),score=29.56 TRINITY_DN31148_c0_g1_i2:45-1856(+)
MARFSAQGHEAWIRSGPIVCHGWLDKQKSDGSRSEPRYVVLRHGGLLGWYQYKPAQADTHTPRCWAYIGKSSVRKVQSVASMMEPLPTFALQIQEARVVEEECTPSFLFACDDETVIQQWQSEMLAVALRLARSGRKESDSYVPWTQRGGGYINEGASDIAGRAMVLCGQYISRWGLYTGEFIEQSMAVAGGWSTSKAAGLLDSAKQKEAERLGSKAGQVAGGVVSTVMQWSCSAVTRLGHTVGGAGYPSYSSRCRGRSHEEVGGDLEDCNTARLYICEVCSASPIVDKGCRLCAIRFCEDCWQAHTQPPTVEKHSSMYAKLNETDARSVENTISNQKKQEAKWRQTQVMALRAALAKVASPPLRDADALRAPPHTDARLRDWPSSRTWSLTPIRNPTLLRGLSDCLKTDPAKLQRGGRDVGIAPMHKKLKLVAAWDLKHEVLWKKYVQGALEVTCQRSQAPGANPQIPLRNECISGDRISTRSSSRTARSPLRSCRSSRSGRMSVTALKGPVSGKASTRRKILGSATSTVKRTTAPRWMLSRRNSTSRSMQTVAFHTLARTRRAVVTLGEECATSSSVGPYWALLFIPRTAKPVSRQASHSG